MPYIDPKSKLLQHIDRVAALKNGAKLAPVNVEIDLSNRCSLGCEWCHFAHTHTRGPLAHKRSVNTGDLMDTELAFRIVAQLSEYGVRSVVWSGGGEPTLHPDFDHIVNASMLPMGMYTNGCHINEERATLLKRRFKWVYISLDASNADDYGAAKGVPPARFHDALAGIKHLTSTDGNATIGVGFLLNANNWQDVPNMLQCAHFLHADYVQFRPSILYQTDAPGELDGSTDWIPGAVELLEDLRNRDGIEVDIKRFWMLRKWKGHGYPVCWWSGLQTVITPDGRVWACLNKRGFDGAALGDLTAEPFSVIWERAPIQMVNDHCRVMCRGHIPNQSLYPMLNNEGIVHGEFI